MPLLPVSQLEKFSPLFRGKGGNALAAILRRVLSVDTLSDIYDKISGFQGPDFAGALLKELKLDYRLGGASTLRSLPGGPFITVSNHPYGGLDGIILVDLIGHIREDFKVMVNEFLNIIEPLAGNWISVNPKNDISSTVTGKNIHGVREVLSRLHDGHPVGFFPSGAVSDLSLKEFRIRDRAWQEPVLRLIQKARVPILPVRFFDHNSMWFYYLGLVNWKIRTLQLPHEIVNKKYRRIRIGIGDMLSVEEQSRHADPEEFGKWLRENVYDMEVPGNMVRYSDYLEGSF